MTQEQAVPMAQAQGFTAALLLADARFPAGGHAHSGGAEPAAATGALTDFPSLELFLRGRLRTSGVTAAGLAAAACETATMEAREIMAAGVGAMAGTGGAPRWTLLDAEADARMPSPAQRTASRQQGRALLRAVRAAWPQPAAPHRQPAAPHEQPAPHGQPAPHEQQEPAWAALGRAPHHPIVLGAAAASAGCSPRQAAHIAAYHSISGPASAAVRLLGLDPIAVSAVVARIAPEIDRIVPEIGATGTADGQDLPFPSAPNLDLLAESHATTEVRLFES